MGEDMEIPVLIVGGGPVGLALALDLGRRGVHSVIIERNAGTGTEFLAKADFLNERSMEFCRLLGLRDEVANAVGQFSTVQFTLQIVRAFQNMS